MYSLIDVGEPMCRRDRLFSVRLTSSVSCLGRHSLDLVRHLYIVLRYNVKCEYDSLK